MPAVTLRPATDGDDAFLRDVYASTRAAELELLPEEMVATFADSQYDLQRHHYLIHHPQATWSVIEVDDVAVGRLVVDRSADPWVLVDIAIHTGARDRGAGTRVISVLQEEAARAGSDLVLNVRVDNHRARVLYSRLSFVPTGTNDAGHAYITMVSRGKGWAP